MMDEKLARGMTKRFLNELAPSMSAVVVDIDRLFSSPPRNSKNQARVLRRLEAKHAPMLGSVVVGRHGGTLKTAISRWTLSTLMVPGSPLRRGGTMSAL